MTDNIAGDELRQIIERIEHKEAEKADISEAIKDDYADAKGRGYCTKTLRTIIRRRKQERDALAEADATLKLYETAIGG